MAQRRQHPYTWTTRPPRLIPGQNSCEWAGWFRANHRGWTRTRSDFDQAQWLTRHTSLLNDQRAHWQNRGYVVSVEDQNAFRLQGTSATLAGKPDRIAANDEEAIIIDVKTD